MNEAEKLDLLHGRLAAIEMIATMAFGMYLANAANDPLGEKAEAAIQFGEEQIQHRVKDFPPLAQAEAVRFGQFALSQVRENLSFLRGAPSSKH